MWAQIDRILRQATTQIVDHVASFLPGVMVALLLIVLTFVAAAVVRTLLGRALRGLRVDHRAEQWAVGALLGWPSAPPTEVVPRIVYWTIVILGLLVSLTALNATIPSRLAMSVFEYVPHVLAALMILAVGAIAGRFLAQSVLIEAVNMQFHSARLLSLTVKWLVWLVAGAMALDHLAIGRRILLLAFGILFGGIVLAAALAIGLGAKDVVGRALERQLHEHAPGDKVDHV